MAGKHVERVRVAKEDFRLATPPAVDEVCDRAIIEIDGIQEDEAADEQRPQMLLESLGQGRITPKRGGLYAVEASRPLIGTQRVRLARLEPFRVEIGSQR